MRLGERTPQQTVDDWYEAQRIESIRSGVPQSNFAGPDLTNWAQWHRQHLRQSYESGVDPRGLVKNTRLEFLEDIIADPERYKALKERSDEIRAQKITIGAPQYAVHSGTGNLVGGIADPSFTVKLKDGILEGNVAQANNTAIDSFVREFERSKKISGENNLDPNRRILHARVMAGENFLSSAPVNNVAGDYAFKRGVMPHLADGTRQVDPGPVRGMHILAGVPLQDLTSALGPTDEIQAVGKQKPLASLVFYQDFRASDLSAAMRATTDIFPAWAEEQIAAFRAEGGEDRIDELGKKRISDLEQKKATERAVAKGDYDFSFSDKQAAELHNDLGRAIDKYGFPGRPDYFNEPLEDIMRSLPGDVGQISSSKATDLSRLGSSANTISTNVSAAAQTVVRNPAIKASEQVAEMSLESRAAAAPSAVISSNLSSGTPSGVQDTVSTGAPLGRKSASIAAHAREASELVAKGKSGSKSLRSSAASMILGIAKRRF
jgi:hypothetical protein